jgi:Ni/Co efflux regulator RcnB
MLKYLTSVVVALALVAAPMSLGSFPAYAATAKKPQTEAQKAAQERQRKCAQEWKQARAAKKVEKGMTWPKFNAACQKRLKASGSA